MKNPFHAHQSIIFCNKLPQIRYKRGMKNVIIHLFEPITPSKNDIALESLT